VSQPKNAADDLIRTWAELGETLRMANPGKFLVVLDIVREVVERHMAAGHAEDRSLFEN
jgi:hypothetical protein